MSTPTRAPAPSSGLGRRAFLTGVAGLGAGAGLALSGLGTGVPRWLGGHPYAELDFAGALARLDASLSPGQRRALVLPADHPSRQVTNTIAILEGPHLGTLLDADQLGLVWRLYETMTSEAGRERLANTVGLEGLLPGCVLTLYGDPAQDGAQVMLSGAHLQIRGGGPAPAGAAFGGPIAYGQQIGNGRFRIEGNAFAVHSDAANRFYTALGPAERAQSILPAPPHELVMQAQGHGGSFEGVSIAGLPEPAREAARELIDVIFETYPAAARAEALSCIDHNGGLDALHVSFYGTKGFYADGTVWADLSPDERRARELPYWQVWRIEGPGTVVFFKGAPHVHAYINVMRDPARQNVGEVLARTPTLLGDAPLRQLLEASLRRETGEPIAWYGDAAPARFCAGDVTTGLAWALDPYGNRVAVVDVEGGAMGPLLRTDLEARGMRIEPGRSYRLATAAYFAGDAERLGTPTRVEESERTLREAIIDYVRAEGLPQQTG